jgi:diamine N-acetyltransferase
VKLAFRRVDASNWRAMLALKVHPEQATFVATPAKSLSICYVGAFGPEYDHVPHVICAGDEAIGYVTIACDPNSRDEYWIDDIMIDAPQQGKGYGRAAIEMTIRMIVERYPRCETIRLTCFRANHVAERIYESLGFRKTGRLTEEFNEPEYALDGPALARYKSAQHNR